MRIELDTINHTITLKEEVNLGELYDYLEALEFDLDDWSIKGEINLPNYFRELYNPNIELHDPYHITTPINPNPFPIIYCGDTNTTLNNITSNTTIFKKK